jgi:hypothetical protein
LPPAEVGLTVLTSTRAQSILFCAVVERERRTMKRTIVALAAVWTATILSATVLAPGAVASTTTCAPGVKAINGVSARTFCGPAKATVKMNGKTISYTGGACSTSIGLFTVNIGTAVLGTIKNAPEYLGVTAKAKIGTQSRQTIAVVHAGKSQAIIGTVTITAGLKQGTFAGKAFGSTETISGSFSC